MANAKSGANALPMVVFRRPNARAGAAPMVIITRRPGVTTGEVFYVGRGADDAGWK